jgi:potassium channel subfamily K, other eukaryote
MFLVIQEAYSSRYKSAVHIRAFDKAIKRYRQRVQYAKPVYGRRGRRLHIRGHNPLVDLSSNVQGKLRSTSRCPSINTLPHPQDATERQKEIVSDSTRRAQECLEALPRHVLRHAKTFHTYVQLFVDDGNILGTRSGGSTKAMTHGSMAEISGSLRKLLDEIAALGGIGKATEQEILQDPDAKHVSDIYFGLSRFG